MKDSCNNDKLTSSSACVCYYSEYGVRLGEVEKKKCDDELFEVVNI